MKLFSERYGYKKYLSKIKGKNLDSPIKNRIWNAFLEYLKYDKYNMFNLELSVEEYIYVLGDKFFKLDISLFHEKNNLGCLDILKSKFYNLKWYEVYDFLEFVYNELNPLIIKNSRKKWDILINNIFKSEKLPYRFVRGRVISLTNKEEIKEIEKVLDSDDRFKPAKEHIEKALKLFSDRENPDYENSIKEAISSLEALSRIILHNNGGTLNKLIDDIKMHHALKEGIKKLYAWTSDESGIRHGNKINLKNKDLVDEAKFMLIFCSSFFNYLVSKYGDKI